MLDYPKVPYSDSLLLLIYINDLTEDFSSNTKLFADDTSLFSVIHDIQTCPNNLNKDLERKSNWVTYWKINFNPDITKQSQEAIFSRKLKKKVILHYCLIMLVFLGHLPKNTGKFFLTIN